MRFTPDQPWILVTNDDGIDAAGLGPFIDAMEKIAPVRAVVPDAEKSWVSKAMTRFDPVSVGVRLRAGHDVYASSGYPADCTQLGAQTLFSAPPSLVVSGINVGSNHGSAFLSTSGTVGAAVEATFLDLPGVALSAVPDDEWEVWAPFMRSRESRPVWERLSAVAAEIVAEVWDNGLPDDVDALSVNIPSEADLETARRVTRVARTRYGQLFEEGDDGFRHRGSFGMRTIDEEPDTDLAAAADRVISITPLRVAAIADARPPSLISRFEK